MPQRELSKKGKIDRDHLIESMKFLVHKSLLLFILHYLKTSHRKKKNIDFKNGGLN